MSSGWVVPKRPRVRWDEKRLRAVSDFDASAECDDEVEFGGVTLRGLTLDLSSSASVSIEDCIIESCVILVSAATEVRIAGSQIRWSDLSGLRISRGCTRSILRECKLIATDFGGAAVQDVIIEESILTGVSLHMSTVRRVEFISCTSTDLDATSAVLEHVSFPDSSLERINFDRARCAAVDLSAARNLSAMRATALSGCRISVRQSLDLAAMFARESGVLIAEPGDD